MAIRDYHAEAKLLEHAVLKSSNIISVDYAVMAWHAMILIPMMPIIYVSIWRAGRDNYNSEKISADGGDDKKCDEMPTRAAHHRASYSH